MIINKKKILCFVMVIMTLLYTKSINSYNNFFISPNKIEKVSITKKQLNASYSGNQSSNLTLKDGDTMGTTTIPAGSNVTWTLTPNGGTSEDNINITGRINVRGKLTIKINASGFTVDEKHYYFRVQNGTYTEIFYIYEGGELIIEGSADNHRIILSGRAGYNSTSNGYNGENSRIEHVSATSGRPIITSSAIKNEGKLNINFFVLENINAETSSAGGGIFQNSSEDIVINNTLIKWIKAKAGSAIYLEKSSLGDLTIKNSDIRQCAAMNDDLGGTIKTVGTNASNITIENTTFEYNYSSGNGGAIYWNASNRLDTSETKKQPQLTIIDSDFRGNYTYDRGGALMIEANTTITGDCIIEDNEGMYGGGIIISGYGGAAQQSTEVSNFMIEIGSGIVLNDNIADYGGGIAFILDDKMTLGVGSSISLIIDGAKIINNTANISGGGIWFGNESLESNEYITNVNLLSGTISKNKSSKSGGGFYLDSVDFVMGDGIISENTASTNGGGIFLNNANLTINGGTILSNTASTNGGGVYIYSDNDTLSNLEIKNGTIAGNEANNGGGLYLESSIFKFSGGTLYENVAKQNGGAFYINDNSEVYLHNGEIYDNQAVNGGAIYQTQNQGKTITNLSGACQIRNNKAVDGNGGGFYIAGGSTVDVEAGKIIKNKATISAENLYPTVGTIAKQSTIGVGGGIYLQKGTFSMAKSKNSAGVYGNTADYAADDLFASGDNTLFDAISVLEMSLGEEYLNSDSWFEDYPKNEKHLSLNLDNRVEIISPNRYKLTNINSMIIATSVLSATNDYICITMGKSLGDLNIKIDDINVALDHVFVYKLKSLMEDNQEYEFIVTKNGPTKIVDIPSGEYNLELLSDWSWRYSDLVTSTIVENNSTRKTENQKSTKIRIYSYKETDITTSYIINNKKWLTTSFFPKKEFSRA